MNDTTELTSESQVGDICNKQDISEMVDCVFYYKNTPMQYTEIFPVVNIENFIRKILIVLL